MTEHDRTAAWTALLQEEIDSAHVYRALSAAENDTARSALLRRLADDEERHASMIRARLGELGLDVPDLPPSRRARVVARLGERFGTPFVVASLTEGEAAAVSGYEALTESSVASEIGADERAHASALRGVGPADGLPRGEAHRLGAGTSLRAAVLGANDGLVSNFSLVMGVAGAGLSQSAILITGLSGLLAGAGSMALGEWISVKSSREYYAHELDVERRELELDPAHELDELVLLYVRKGVPPEDAERIAGHILSDPERALDTMAREELGIDPGELGGSPTTAAVTSFLLFCAGAVIPVVAYTVLAGSAAIAVSAALSLLGLFLIGAAITLVTGRNWLRSGLRQVAFGLAAAAVTFGIGRLLGVTVG